MSARVIPIRRCRVAPAKASPMYPLPEDGLHLLADGDGWVLVRHAGGQSVSMRLSLAEAIRLGDMLEVAVAVSPLPGTRRP